MDVENQEELPETGDGNGQHTNPKPTLAETIARGRHLRSDNKDQGFKLLSGDVDGISYEKLQLLPNRVGLVYDERMLRPHCAWDDQYSECPARASSIWTACEEHGLIQRCVRVPAREATVDELQLVHDRTYVSRLREICEQSEEEMKQSSKQYDAVYFHKNTYEAAVLAAGSSIDLVENVVKGELKHGMAIVRPPGHHAMRSEASGFCFINNVALAAKHAVENLKLKRVLIVDIDVHHGQGTQQMFYDDPRVLYFSVHRYEWGKFWPNLRESDYDFIGSENARGYNINVPINEVGVADGDYMAIIQQILLPVAYEFTPQLVLVSQGYDAVLGDAEGRSHITPAWYPHFIHALKPLAGGKLALILEGGYCIKAQAEAAALSLRELLDDPVPSLPPLLPPKQCTRESILQALRVLRPYWKSLGFQRDAQSPHELPDFFENIQIPKPGIKFCNIDGGADQYELLGDDYETYPEEMKQQFELKLDILKENTKLLKPTHKVCLVYDEKMRGHKCTTQRDHPERPSRITRIFEKLQETGLTENCLRLPTRLATDDELRLVHDGEYIDEVRLYQTQELEELHRQERTFNSIYLAQETYECAALATGSTLNVVDSVLTGESAAGVCVVRPPGHHAESDTCMGFCFFNSVAVAARYAQKHYGLKRVLIVDWDVHHGNGTQNMFYDDPSVLYLSVHRHDNGGFFPIGPDGNHTFAGSGEGEGFNINIGWSKGGMGDAEYLAAFQQVVMPVAYEFAPELVLISAGFDAARGDPLGGCRISPEGYAHLTSMLMGLAMGRVILVLEGGYNLYSISESMAACACSLMGYPCPPLHGPMIATRSAERSICETLDCHTRYWKSLCFTECMISREETKAWLNDKTVKNEIPKDEVEALGQQLSGTAIEDSFSGSESLSDTEVDKSTLSQNEPVKQEHDLVLPSPLKADMDQQDQKPGKEQLDKIYEDAGLEEGASGGSDNPHMSVPLDFLGGAVQTQGNVTMYAVYPLKWCEHLISVQQVPGAGLDVTQPCQQCQHVGENWVCLTCYQVHCGRFINEHMLMHGLETEHRMVLSYADLSVWCYACDSYVHNEALLPVKRAAHISKFNEDIPGHS